MGTRVITHATSLAGVTLVETEIRRDARGEFARFFCTDQLASLLGSRSVAQINGSTTRLTGSVRGLHFQHPPHAEMKLVRCLHGRVFDVAVDLRAGSPTFLRWYGVELSAENARMLVIPEGCAHGFQTMEPDSQLLYLHTAYYTPEAEDGIAWNDPAIAVHWPLGLPPPGGLSPRDESLPAVTAAFRGVAC